MSLANVPRIYRPHRPATATQVAVYGTLRLGEGNWAWALRDTATHLGRGAVAGFRLHGAGLGFPYAVPTDDTSGAIVVDVFTVDPDTMAQLDRLEGFPSHYLRTPTPYRLDDGTTGTAWLYHPADADRFPADDPRIISSGDWLADDAGRRRSTIGSYWADEDDAIAEVFPDNEDDEYIADLLAELDDRCDDCDAIHHGTSTCWRDDDEF